MRTKALAYAFFSIVLIGFVLSPVIHADELQDALDNPEQTNGTALIFTSQTGSGGALWSADTTTFYTAPASAKSGHISGNMYSTLTTTVYGPASLSFYQKVSSQTSSDTLKFMINGAVKSTISGVVDWQQKMFTLATGTYTLQWKYAKNATIDSGIDAAWVDKVIVSPYTKLIVTGPTGTLLSGSTATISWNAPAAADKYLLYYTTNGSTWIAVPGASAPTYLPGTGFEDQAFAWTVPAPTGNTTKARVKVVAYNAANKIVAQGISSVPFAITMLRVTSPNGGEFLNPVTTPTATVSFTLYGQPTPTAQTATLAYTINGGASWPVITTLPVSGPGTYSGEWSLPAVTKTMSARVRVTLKSSTGASVGTDISDAVFMILPSFSISGTVMQAGKPLANATMTLSGADAQMTSTDSSGKYSFASLAPGGYTVAASKSGWVFTPASLAVIIASANMATANFTGTANAGQTYTISGTVSGATASGVVLTLSGTKPGTAVTDGSGNYSFSNLVEGNYNIMPAKTGYTFNPVSAGLALSADAPGIDFTSSAGTGGTYSISGKVTYGGSGMSGVTVAVNGSANASVVTDTLGNFSVKGLTKGAYTLTPGPSGYDVMPQSVSKTITGGNITGVTFTATSLTEYAPFDLAGTWYSAGIRTPVKGSGDTSRFGYDIDRIVLGNNGSGSITHISQSDPTASSSFPPGTITIERDGASAGMISNGDPNTILFMNKHKDVVYQLLVEQEVSEQELFFVVKKGLSYSAEDLAGTWFAAGIKTLVKNNYNSANFGYDVTELALASDGSGTAIQILSSDSTATTTFPAGTFTISSGGVISNGDPDSFWFMNAHKDVMSLFFKDPNTGEQQLFLFVKKADSYSAADLAGTWFAAGTKTPVKNTFDSANFGYDAIQLVLAGDGSGTATQISSSDPSGPTALPTGSMVISSDGVISDGDPNSLWFMNADKDTMYHFMVDTDTGQQQLFIYLKQAQPNAPVGGSYSISGTVTNLTPQTGPLLICVTTDPTFNSTCNYGAAADGGGAYTVSNIPAGSYYVGALQDMNSNGHRDGNEPQGAYGAPTSIMLTDNVTGLNFSIGWPQTFAVETNPTVIRIDANGNAWVSNFGSNSVSKVSLNGTVVSYPVGTNPHGLDIDSSGNVWVANYGSNNVWKLSPSGSHLATYSVGTNPRGLHIDASGNVWVANHGGGGGNLLSNTVTELGPDGSLIGTYTVGKGPFGITTDGSGNVWVTNKGGATTANIGTTVTELAANGTLLGTFTVGFGPHAIKIDPSGNVWVSNAGNDTTLSETVMKLDGSGNRLGTFVVGIGPHGLAVDVSGNVWAADYGTNAAPGESITRLDAAGTPMNTFPSGGDNPAGMAIDASGNVWVSNYGSGTVGVLPGAASAGYNP